MSPEGSPSAGWRETAEAMQVEPGLPEQLEESAEDVREAGYEDLAMRLEAAAAQAREAVANE